jgi:vacuolar protein sorting-associated protein 13A/C
LGVNWLKSAEQEKYFNEVYICHLEMRKNDFAAILTETRVVMIVITPLKVEYDVHFNGVFI